MTREEIILHYFQKKNILNTSNPFYQVHISELFKWMVNGDDITHDKSLHNLHLHGTGEAEIISKQKGLIAGVEEIVYLLSQFTQLTIIPKMHDGDEVVPGQKILIISGGYNEIIAYERVILNILGKMSGVATMTNTLVSQIGIQPPFLASTRKTPLMFLDKKAVAVGGGVTHRLNLSDWAMIKDNHLKILQKETNQSLDKVISNAIMRMLEANVPFFEIEVESSEEAVLTAKAFLEKKSNRNIKTCIAILLDNFEPLSANNVILQIKNVTREPFQILFEVSGGITSKNLLAWTKTGTDIISLGALTHSSPTLDLSLSII